MKKINFEEQKEIREQTINLHCDVLCNYYVEKIKKTNEVYYEGYIWDIIKSKVIELESTLFNMIQEKKTYLLFCDLHSYEHVLEAEFREFGYDTMLKLSGYEYKEIINKLPNDYYLITQDLTNLFCFTHETIEEERYCIYSVVV